MGLVLASASPRRADLLRAAGFTFDVLPVDVDEQFLPGEKPREAVSRLAEAKAVAAAAALAAGLTASVILGADTAVVVHGQALGKPADEADAGRMLRLLSGQTHEVMTGICLLKDQGRLVHVETTDVRMARLTEAEIAWYVGTGEPFDKAGGYAVQGLGARFIEGIDGSYSNVVGLPISRLYTLMKELGCAILAV